MAIRPMYIQAPPQAAPARYGLLDTFDVKPLPPEGGLAGVEYDTEFCGIVRPWVNPCVDPGVAEKVADDGIDQTTGDPIVVYHLFSCRLPGSGTEADRLARAKRALETGASRGLERGFGDVIGQYIVDNGGDVTPGGTPVGVIEGLALLEQAGGEDYSGQRVIHADNAVVTYLISQGLVQQVGDHLETLLGSLVVSGPGYALSTTFPSAPAAGAHWMYATGMVNIWAGSVTAPPLVLNQGASNNYDNEFMVLAERTFVPTFECFASAVEVLLEA